MGPTDRGRRGERARLAVAVALAVAGGAGSVSAAERWETVRAAVIDPINSAFHRHLPKDLQRRDLDAVLGLYATETGGGLTWSSVERVHPGREEMEFRWGPATGEEPIRDRYQRLLDELPTIDRAEVRIHRVHWERPGPDGYPAELRWVVRGIRPDGSRGQLDQRTRVHLAQREGRWVITSEDVTARSLVVRAEPRFEVATRAAGIDSVHTNEGSPVYKVTDNLSNAGGCAVADVDGDGREDLFLAGSPGAVLYRNEGDGTFTDVTVVSGLPQPYPDPATGTAFFDYDNDGWPDLYVAAATRGDRLFRNLGHGRFLDVTEAAGIPRGRWASMPIVADYDRDGFLDVYVVRMGDHAERPPRPNYEAHNGIPNTLLRNQGDGTFRDVTAKAGVGDTGWGLAGVWSDVDDDGWPDLYLGNEFGSNALYRNNGDGTFSERTRASRIADPGAAMGLAFGDYDGDGRGDFFVSNMYANSRWALFHPDFPVPIPWPYRVLGRFTDGVRRRSEQIFEGLTRGDALLRNRGDGIFEDVGETAGIRDAQWGWGAEFLDYDNDGRLDVYATNGFVTGELPDDV
jgi:hypothetical protein